MDELIPEYSRVVGLPLRWKLTGSCKALGCRPDYCAFFNARVPCQVVTSTNGPTKDFRLCQYHHPDGKMVVNFWVPIGEEMRLLLYIDPVPSELDIQTLPEKLKFIGKWIHQQLYQQGKIEKKLKREQKYRACAERFRKVFEDHKTIQFLVLPEDRSILEANAAACKFYGYKRSKLRGRSLNDIKVQVSEAGNRELGPNGEQNRDYFIEQHRLKDGSIRDVEVYSSLVSFDERDLQFLVVHDITERKRIEKQLHVERERSSRVLEGTRAGTWEWNMVTGEVVFNERWAEILGYDLKDLSGTIETWYGLVHPEDRERSNQLIRQHKAGKKDYYDCECRMLHKDGHWIWVHDRGKIISRDSEGKPLIMAGTHIDVTKRKEADQKLLELNQKLEKQIKRAKAQKKKAQLANASKTEFLAVMSHEIRTPLNSILGMNQLLQTTKLDLEQQELVKGISDSGFMLLEVINEILDFSRLNSGRVELEEISFDVSDLLLEVKSLFHTHALEKGLKLSIEANIDDCLSAMGDPYRLKQILINLVGNAIKFTDAGSIVIRVKKEDSPDEGLSFEVSDTGIGIEKKHQRQLFTAFSQADASTTRRFGGTGLGLAICKKLVDAMGGVIAVESKPGGGSTFRFTLPLETCISPKRKISAAPVESVSLPEKHSTSILVAEDNHFNQNLIERMLNRLGYVCDLVSNGELAVEACKKETYDIVLMDVHMPVVDGFEATRLIRESIADSAQPVIIAITARGLKGDRENCLSQGMDDYIVKPIALDELDRTLSRWIHARAKGTVIR